MAQADAAPAALDLAAGLAPLTRQLCDIPSVSGDERALADAVQSALDALPGWVVSRDGNAVVARTERSAAQRVVLAGHLDTVPVADNLPVRVEGDQTDGTLHGRGTVDMKGGLAVMLDAARRLAEPHVAARYDVTLVFYDCEEVEATRNGLGRLVRDHPDWVRGDAAVLLEPTEARLEGGCNGTMRIDVVVPGVAAHSARSWRGENAIHAAGDVLDRLRAYSPREAQVDGLVFREGLNAVGISGGIAGNVIPDRCIVTVNHRFAPDRDEATALAHLREVFAGYQIVVTDSAPGARPGMDHPIIRSLARVADQPVGPKYGWTDVARFTSLGIPAVNFGPGNPELAHRDDERVPIEHLRRCADVVLRWLCGAD